MKLTNKQLLSANTRIKEKYPEDNVVLNNDLRDKTRVVYDTLKEPTKSEEYLKGHLTSLLNTEKDFIKFFFSI